MRVVAVGGGHGLARALEALRQLDVAPTAVVTVADDGGSSGRLRDELDIIPPGDLRMALLTLAQHRALADVLAHRFTRGHLRGHPLGNLLLVALSEQADGDWLAALERAAELLACAGRVLPATTVPVRLHATVAGQQVDGQVRVATAAGRVERVWLEPCKPPACEAAVQAVDEADVVVLGPGSLFTSVIATLLVPDLAAAVARTRGRVLYIGNVGTQAGETSGLDADAHVAALVDHVPGLRPAAVLLHDGPPPPEPSAPLGTVVTHAAVQRVVRADVIARGGTGHDSRRLAAALAPLLAGADPPGNAPAARREPAPRRDG